MVIWEMQLCSVEFFPCPIRFPAVTFEYQLTYVLSSQTNCVIIDVHAVYFSVRSLCSFKRALVLCSISAFKHHVNGHFKRAPVNFKITVQRDSRLYALCIKQSFLDCIAEWS